MFAVKLLIVAIAIALWAVASHSGLLDPRLFPSPRDVGDATLTLLSKPNVRAEIFTTLGTVLISLLISMPVGIFVGAVISSSEFWKEVMKPILFFPLSIPKSIFLPLFILAVGIGPMEKILFGVFSVVFLAIVFTIAAIESIEPAHLRVARSFGASQFQTLWRVYIPSMLPTLLEGLRLSVIFAVTAVVLAEMYASKSGFGSLISAWGEGFQVLQLTSSVVIISICSIVANELIRWFEHKSGHWRA